MASSNTGDLGFNSLGVSIKYLIEVYGPGLSDELTTADLFKQIKGRKLGVSLVQHWANTLENATNVIGVATVYVVHSYNQNIKESLLSCLANYLSKHEDVFVWIDFLCLNLASLQRQLRSYDWWGPEFINDLKRFDEVLLAWSDWSNYDLLKRSWAVWEIYMAFVAQIPIAVTLTVEQDASLVDDIVDGFLNLVIGFKDLDIVTTDCGDRRMKKKILASVKKNEEDFEVFNEACVLPAKQWWVFQANEIWKEMQLTHVNNEAFKKNLKFFNALTYLARSCGLHDIVTEVGMQVNDLLEKNPGFCKEYPMEAAREYNNLSVLFTEVEKFIEAVDSGEKSVTYMKDYIIYHMDNSTGTEEGYDGLIPERRYVATGLNNQANLLINLEQYPLAIEKYLESIQLKTELYGPDHELVAAGLNNLGLAYAASRDLISAERVYRQALQTRVRIFGEGAIEVAQTRHNLADILFKENHLVQAKQEAQKAYNIVLNLLGAENDITILFKEHVDTIAAQI